MTEIAFEKELPAVLARAESLPSLPAVAVEVLRLTQDEECTLDDLAAVIGRDPALSAKLLKLANSSLFTLGHEVATLQRATMVLGMKTVKLMSLSFSLVSAVPREGRGRFDYEGFWRRSLTAAVAGRALSAAVGARSIDEAFLCGLLSHIGQMVLARALPEEYDRVLDRAGRRWPTPRMEREVMGFDSADVAGSLLQSWKLPAAITLPVAYVSRPDDLPEKASDEVKDLTRLSWAAQLSVAVLCDEEKGAALERLRGVAQREHGLEAEVLEELLVSCESGVAETAELLSVRLEDGASHQEIVERARMQIVQIGLGTAMDLASAERRASVLEAENRKLASAAQTDVLTGLPNRAAFDEVLAVEIRERTDADLPHALALVLFDVDCFKAINDTYGHPAGDAVLAALGRLLAATTRRSDFAARYGGEEFALLVRHTTPAILRTIAERLRRAIEAEVVRHGTTEIRVTASLGGACLARATGPEDAAELLRVADAYLYKAKENGRNRIEVYSQTELPRR